VYATVNPGLSDFPRDRVEGYLTDVQRAIEAIPGVESVSRIQVRPLQGGGNFSPANIPGNPRNEGFDPRFLTSVNDVGPEVFETLAIPLVAGRPLQRTGNGVVVDQRFAETFFGSDNVVGRRFGTGPPGNDDVYEIVGVAQNIVSLQLRADQPPMFYVRHEVTDSVSEISFAIRTARDPGLSLPTIRSAVASVDPSVPLTALQTQQELLDRMLRTERMLAFLSAGFSAIATVLAAIGLGGLLAYAVARRTSEIGLRMALGAAPTTMVAMVMKDSLKLIAGGFAIGVPCAFVVMKLLEASLYEPGSADPATLAASVMILIAISLVSALLPAYRAARTAPNAALREE